MRDLILRQTHAAHRHGARSQMSHAHLQLFTSQQLRFKADRAAPLPTQNHTVTAPHRGNDRFRSAPGISTDPKLAIRGLVPTLDTTRPAPLDLPEPPHPLAYPSSRSKNPSKWDFKYLFRLGKAYGSFYWTGIKNVYANHKTRTDILKRLGGTPPDMAARIAGAPQQISYNEYELLLRANRDVKKLIPFGLIFAICGEFTPLIIVLLGSKVVPGTCVIPKQVTQDRKKMLAREKLYMDLMTDTYSSRAKTAKSGMSPEVTRSYLIPDAYRLGLSPLINISGPLGSLYWNLRLEKRLKQHTNEILSTASLVQREGGWAKKSPLDMWEWGNKYGMYALRQYVKEGIERGEDPVSEKMKKTLLDAFEAETKALVDAAKRGDEEGTGSPWAMEIHDPLLWDRPDCVAMRRDIEGSVSSKQPKTDVKSKKS